MGANSKRRMTMAKMARERLLQERRVAKQEKKDERKRAAMEESSPDAAPSADAIDGDTPGE